MSGELTWREAEDAMLAGEEVECMAPGGALWVRQRIEDGVLRVQGISAAGRMWMNDEASYDELRASKWRRVPAAPKLGELSAKWRYRDYSGERSRCAAEIEAALKAGEWVDLREVDAAELRRKASAIAVHSHVAEERKRNFVAALLAVLREKAVRP